MKRAELLLATLFLSLLIISCSSTNEYTKEEWTEVEDQMKDLQEISIDIIEDGGVAAYGEGLSTRKDIAKEKARASADGALAEIFNKKIDRLKKNYLEEVGQGKDSEVNELFSIVTKELTSQVLVGAYEKDSKMIQNNKNEYLCGIVMAITPKTLNLSIMDEMKNNKPELYQRFRASQAFDELDKELKKYEESQSK